METLPVLIKTQKTINYAEDEKVADTKMQNL